MDIIEALDEIRMEAKISDQRDLAKLLGVSQGTISNYLKGKSEPTKKLAAEIYHKYGFRCEPFTGLALVKYIEKHL